MSQMVVFMLKDLRKNLVYAGYIILSFYSYESSFFSFSKCYHNFLKLLKNFHFILLNRHLNNPKATENL